MDLQSQWITLSLAFALGLRHGMDPDHLVTIDGLTRYNATARPPLARWCGMLFSSGHGAVVAGAALAFSYLGRTANMPAWLNGAGVLFSTVLLFGLGCINLFGVLHARHRHYTPLGLRSALFGRVMQVSKPWTIALIGALFAISFDTVSQAGFLALAAAQHGGWQVPLTAALFFTLGMMTPDTFNGLLVSRVAARPDRLGFDFGRLVGAVIALLSFAMAAYRAVGWFTPDAFALDERQELVVGIALVAAAFVSYVFMLTRRVHAP